MTRHHLGFVLALTLLLPGSAAAQEATGETCPPTPGIQANQDVIRGRCLFNSSTIFQQDPKGPFASCSRCHYGSQKTDHSVHLVRVTNRVGQTIEVLRKTPSLLKAAHNAPEPFGCYVALGVTLLFAFESLVNAGMALSLLPTKGMALPFLSYGMSSVVASLFAAGILLSVSGGSGGFLKRPAGGLR